MNGAWLYLPEVLTVLLAALAVVFVAWLVVLITDVINHSTVETSASGEAASSGAGIWAVEPSLPTEAGQTTGIAPASRVGIGSPAAADSPTT